MGDGGAFNIETENGTISLTTTSFSADRGSVLHSGIFNKELASSFVAAIVASAFIIFSAVFSDIKLLHYFIAAIIFVIIFPLARIYIFKEPELKTVLNRKSGTLTITLTGPLGKKKIEKPLGALRDISVDHIRIEPENPDGIKIVERIALQHGTVIPGFGEVKEFYNVNLEIDNERHMIFSTSVVSDAEEVVREMKDFIHK